MRQRTKIYLDTSVYNRPFDDQRQARIRLEAEAFLSILEKTMAGAVSIISSSVVAYENSLSPFPARKERVSDYIALSSRTVKMSQAIRKRATILETAGFDSLDAMHLACAEAGDVEYFITCDDNITKKAKRNPAVVSLIVCSPLQFLIEEVF
ncbi:MAG: PIN domain-containing protein [Nitrospirota bacterium]|nr:PIN domain-containing protein [Nitrospirota bacterium]